MLFLGNSRFRNCTERERNIYFPAVWPTVTVLSADGKLLFSVTSVFDQIYQPEMLENAFSMVSKLNCSLWIERLGTCIDLNEPEVDCMNWRIRSVNKK